MTNIALAILWSIVAVCGIVLVVISLKRRQFYKAAERKYIDALRRVDQ